MSHADIEDYCGEDEEDHSTVIVCPWHRWVLSPFVDCSGLFNCYRDIGTILIWPLGRARPDFERAFMRFVSNKRSRMGRRKFGSKPREGVPGGSW